MKLKYPRFKFFIFGFIIIVLAFTNCTKVNDTTPAEPTSPPQTQTVDPWTAPVGDPVLGADLADGWQDLRELPGPVNILGGWTDSVAISASGRSLYFAYSMVDAFQFMDSGGVNKVFSGPIRPGMIGREFRIFRADLTTTGWTVNYHPINTPDDQFAQASVSPNASEDLIVFTRWDTVSYSHGNLYYAVKTGDTWSAPLPIPVNSGCEDDNGFVVGNFSTGIDLYFESNRGDDQGSVCGGPARIYHTHFDPANGGSFSPVVKVPGF